MRELINGQAPGADPHHPIDRHVGRRIRMRRQEIGFSQAKLAAALGLSYQQVQTYECGKVRVSASTLWEISKALETRIGWFYEELMPSEAVMPITPKSTAAEFLLTEEGVQLASLFLTIPTAEVRRKVVSLVRAIVDDE